MWSFLVLISHLLPRIRVCGICGSALRSRSHLSDFSKTLFTPAGLDIYVRHSPISSEANTTSTTPAPAQSQTGLISALSAALHKNEAEVVRDLAVKGFTVVPEN